jgi:hypothetical protein
LVNIKSTIDEEIGFREEPIPEDETATFEINKPTNLNDSLTIAGKLTVESGISGSHHKLANGSDAFVAAGSITLNTQSNGSVRISGSTAFMDVAETSNSTNLSAINYTVFFVDASSGSLTLTLADATTSGTGSYFHIKKKDSTNNQVTVSASSGQLIDGQPSQTIFLPYSSLKLVSFDNNWWII